MLLESELGGNTESTNSNAWAWNRKPNLLMTEHNANEEQGKNESESRPKLKKKPYQEPAFRFEKVFETMALSCGKVQPTTLQCKFSRKNS